MRRLKEFCTGGVLADAGVVIWNRDTVYYRSGDWRGTWDKEGGGVLTNQALHTLDLLQWVCGMPASLTANLSNDHLSDTIEVEDTASLLMESADGKPFNFFATTASGTDFPVQLRVETADGTRILAENDLLCTNGVPVSLSESHETTGKAVWGDGHKRLIADFYRCFADGVPFPVDAEEGAKSVRLILAAYASHGKSIAIPD